MSMWLAQQAVLLLVAVLALVTNTMSDSSVPSGMVLKIITYAVLLFCFLLLVTNVAIVQVTR